MRAAGWVASEVREGSGWDVCGRFFLIPCAGVELLMGPKVARGWNRSAVMACSTVFLVL